MFKAFDVVFNGIKYKIRYQSILSKNLQTINIFKQRFYRHKELHKITKQHCKKSSPAPEFDSKVGFNPTCSRQITL